MTSEIMREWLQRLMIELANIETAGSAYDLVKQLNILDAVYSFKSAWDRITTTTIKIGFLKARYSYGNLEEQTIPGIKSNPADDLQPCVGTYLHKFIKKRVHLV